MTRYDLLGERPPTNMEDAATEEASPPQLLQEMLQNTLQAADLVLATKGGSVLAPILAQVLPLHPILFDRAAASMQLKS